MLISDAVIYLGQTLSPICIILHIILSLIQKLLTKLSIHDDVE